MLLPACAALDDERSKDGVHGASQCRLNRPAEVDLDAYAARGVWIACVPGVTYMPTQRQAVSTRSWFRR
jgi:hypothetical protein